MRRFVDGWRDLQTDRRRRENTPTPDEWKIPHGREMDGCCFDSGDGGRAEERGRQMDEQKLQT